MSYESITTSANTEALYTAFFEALSSKSYLMRADAPRYTILAVTNSHLELTGLQKEEMIGRGVFDVFPPNTSDPSDTGGKDFLASLQHVLSYKEPHYLPAQRYDITGSDGCFMEKYWRAESKPVLSPDSGEVLYIIHTTEDITDQVKAAEMKEQIKGMEEAAALKRLYETITNNTPDLIYVFDLNYRFTYANNALLTMWGKTWEDATDKGLVKMGMRSGTPPCMNGRSIMWLLQRNPFVERFPFLMLCWASGYMTIFSFLCSIAKAKWKP